MQGEVYADLYVLINAGMDLIALMITGTLLHRRTRKWRMLAASLLGGLYALAVLLLLPTGWLSTLLDLGVGVLLSAIAMAERRQGLRGVLWAGAAYVLVSMLLGGVMTVLYGWLGRMELPLELLGEDGISVWIFSLLATCAGWITARGGRFLGRARRTESVEVEAVLFGRRVSFTALEDTGNFLRDPISGRGVILVEAELLRAVLPPAFFSETDGETRSAWMREGQNAAHIRPIPAQTAAGEALLWAAVPDRVLLHRGRRTLTSDHLIAPAMLGRGAVEAVIARD